MKHLIKKSEFFNAVQDRDFYYEIYKNPTSSDLNKIKKGDPAILSFRGIITSDGTVYVWSGNLLHKSALVDGQVPEGLHFDLDSGSIELYILPGMEPNDIYNIIANAKNNLSSLNINDSFSVIMNTGYYRAKKYPIYDKIKTFGDLFVNSLSVATLVSKRLIKKSEFYNADQIGVNYTEVFKNPSANEAIKAKRIDGSLRGVIDFNSRDVYIWRGEVLHERVLNNPNLKIPDGLHFAADDKFIELYLLPEFYPEYLKEVLLSARSKLEAIGITESTRIAHLNTDYYGTKDYQIYEDLRTLGDIYNMKIEEEIYASKKLIKKSEFYGADKINGNYIEVYKNPSTIEAKEAWDEEGGLRGIIDFNSSDLYIWRGNVLHEDILSNEEFSIPDGLHFSFDGRIEIYLLPQFNPELLKDMFLSAKSKLETIGIKKSTVIAYLSASYYGAKDYQIYKKLYALSDIYNMEVEEEVYASKKLIKKSEFFNADEVMGDYVEVFKNPSFHDKYVAEQVDGNIRGVISFNSNDLYIWRGDILHDDILKNSNLQVPDGIHIGTDNGRLDIYLIPEVNPEILRDAFVLVKSKLEKIGITDTMKIAHCSTRYYGAKDYPIYDTLETVNDIYNIEIEKVELQTV